ncbi:DUF5615 family PIN-like protein [Sphingosinicella rhizophila]|uniref:DUF5615 family PIN-like protein n=1 Tax=Sphingosinicella rhizophila TaxID=3050082 RepID=A0ABU3Q563_9SPHN|nr:DUF5615 family PIN-like protein [Sphingosinicella sp. GR2756]MDT9598546.1 DUF5615 family PIN-like protein [Sphingosinicella sp. GR2756]
MKIRADEHVAPAIVVAIRDMALSEGWNLDSVREAGDNGSTDVHWITKFASEGGDAILSADADFIKTAPQVMAVFRTGLKVIHLPHQWGMAEGRLQAAHVLLWWKRIEECLQSMRRQECYKPAWTISEIGKMVKVDLDFQRAKQRLKKAAKKG